MKTKKNTAGVFRGLWRRSPFREATALAVTLLAAGGIYHRLVVPRAGGYPGWTVIRWSLRQFMYPRLIFNSDSIASGIFPLWNPYHYAGGPWVGNFQSGLFQPLNWIVWIFGGHTALILQYQVAAIFLLGGAGMFFCVRSFGRSRPAAAVGALSFSAGGFFLGNGTYFPQINTLALFPFALLFARRLFLLQRWRDLMWASVFFALLAAGGFPTMSFFLGLAALGAGWGGAPAGERAGPLSRPRAAALLVLFTLLLSAPLLLPALESYPWLHRAEQIANPGINWEEVVAGKSLAPANLLSAVAAPAANWDISGYRLWVEFRNCYAGLLPLIFFACFIIRGRGRERNSIAVIYAAAVFLALGFNNPAYAAIYRYFLPVRLVSHPAMDFRAVFLALTALGAGLGFDRRLLPGERKHTAAVGTALILAGGLGLLWMIRRFDYIRWVDFSTPLLLWAVTAAAALAAVAAPLPARLRPLALTAFVALDLGCWNNYNFSSLATPASISFWERRAEREGARRRRVDDADELTRRAEFPRNRTGSMFWKYFSDSGLDGAVLQHFLDVASFPSVKTFSAPFRIKPLEAVEVIEDRRILLTRIAEGDRPEGTGLVYSGDVPRSLRQQLENTGPAGGFRGRVTAFSPNRIVYEVTADRPTILFFNEIHYPGWRLSGNGQALPLFRLNHAFRGSLVGAGEHRLVMSYRPPSFYLGLALFAAGLAFLLFAAGKGRFSPRPSRPVGPE